MLGEGDNCCRHGGTEHRNASNENERNVQKQFSTKYDRPKINFSRACHFEQ